MNKPKTVDEYFSTLSPEAKKKLGGLRKKIKDVVPEAEEYIGYGMPAYKYKGKPLIYYAAFKDHYSIFPTSTPMGKLEKELEPYQTGKGTLQYPLGSEFPEELLKKLLKARIEDIEAAPGKPGY